jgi:hypothetical protein
MHGWIDSNYCGLQFLQIIRMFVNTQYGAS